MNIRVAKEQGERAATVTLVCPWCGVLVSDVAGLAVDRGRESWLVLVCPTPGCQHPVLVRAGKDLAPGSPWELLGGGHLGPFEIIPPPQPVYEEE